MDSAPECEATKVAETIDRFDCGTMYEAAHELINFEIAEHLTKIRKLKKKSTSQARSRCTAHTEAVKSLVKLQGKLDPKNPRISEAVMLLLESFHLVGK